MHVQAPHVNQIYYLFINPTHSQNPIIVKIALKKFLFFFPKIFNHTIIFYCYTSKQISSEIKKVSHN